MTKSLKGALLSGLIFPGVGQVFLKHYKRGIALMLIVTANLLVIIVKTVQGGLTILEKIKLEADVLDMNAISSAVTQALDDYTSLTVNLALIVTTIFWVFGTIDAYRIGKKLDNENNQQ